MRIRIGVITSEAHMDYMCIIQNEFKKVCDIKLFIVNQLKETDELYLKNRHLVDGFIFSGMYIYDAIKTDHLDVKLPMRVLAQGQSVARIVVAAIAEFMDMRGIHDALHADCRHPATGQGALVLIRHHHNLDPEPRIAPALGRDLVQSRTLPHPVAPLRRETQHGSQRDLFLRQEIRGSTDQYPLGPLAEVRIEQTSQKVRIEPHLDRQRPVRRRLPIRHQRLSNARRPDMMKRHVERQFGALPVGNDGIEEAEPIGQIGGHRKHRLLDLPPLRHFQHHEEQERLMRCRIPPRPVNPQRRQFMQPVIRSAAPAHACLLPLSPATGKPCARANDQQHPQRDSLIFTLYATPPHCPTPATDYDITGPTLFRDRPFSDPFPGPPPF